MVAATVHAVQSDVAMRQRLIYRQSRPHQSAGRNSTPTLSVAADHRPGRRFSRPPLEIQIQGPFETSYSLAVMNRRFAPGTGPVTRPGRVDLRHRGTRRLPACPCEDLALDSEATALLRRADEVPFPDVVIRQMYPPRVIDTPGGITCEYFGWEESRIPRCDGRRLQFLPRRGGSDVGVRPRCPAGLRREHPHQGGGQRGLNLLIPMATVDAPELHGLRGCTFLHISSAFPRKGVDVLLRFCTCDSVRRRE